jgi:hypothetical protein
MTTKIDALSQSYLRMNQYVEEAQYEPRLREQAIQVLTSLKSWFPSERAAFLKMLAGIPAFPGIEKESIIRRTMLLLEASEMAAASQRERPHTYRKEKGWKPLRQPTPGRHSGATKERDAGWK